MTFEEYFKKLETRSQTPSYISSKYINSVQNIDEYNSNKYINSENNKDTYISSEYINSTNNIDKYNSKNYINTIDKHKAENSKIYINSLSNNLSEQSEAYINQPDTSNDSLQTFSYITSGSKQKSLGWVTNISDVYTLLKENIVNNVDTNTFYNIEFSVDISKINTNKPTEFFKNNYFIENTLKETPNPTYLNDFKTTYTLNGENYILYSNYNLSDRPVHTYKTDDESGIFAKTAFNPKNDKGKVKKAEKELNYKVHLRNYWKSQGKGTSNGGDIYGGLVGTQITPDNGYRQRLVDRMKGYTNSDNTITSKNFIAGIGVEADEYKDLMSVDDLMTISGGGIPKSVLNATDGLRYGTIAKRDTIIDTGRFTKDVTKNVSKFSEYSPRTPSTNRGKLFTLMKSFFATSPTRTPYYRTQLLALGTEVTNINAMIDANRITKINYSIKFLNDKETMYPAAESVHSGLVASKATPISMLNKRAPDFMSNMYNVFITVNNNNYSTLYKNNINATGHDKTGKDKVIFYDDYLDKFFNENTFSSNIFATRCTGIQIKLPELKSNSINYLGRKIPYIESNINWTHEGTFTIRLDEKMDIYKGILSLSGIDYQAAGNEIRDNPSKENTSTNTDSTFSTTETSNVSKNVEFTVKELFYRLNTIKPTSVLYKNSTSRSGSSTTTNKNFPILDLHVRYGFVNASIPMTSLSEPSTPFGTGNVVDYAPNGNEPYYREYVFTNIKFYGLDELELSKDSESVEISVPFIFADMYEVISGHSYATTAV